MIELDGAGRTISTSSGGPALVSSSTWRGAGDSVPGPPIVAADGTAYIVSTEGGSTTIVGLDPSGQPLAGWPYRSNDALQETGICAPPDVGCGWLRTAPAIGEGGRLYVLLAPTSPSTGGSIVSVASDGRTWQGWPVRLQRAGSMFWSAVGSADGSLAWALAVEPEKAGYSATIVGLAADSTVLFRSTVVEP
jgi:hypothetical protein